MPYLDWVNKNQAQAAAGLALQGLLQEQLGDVTQVQYTITDSWDEPEFEPVLDKPADG